MNSQDLRLKFNQLNFFTYNVSLLFYNTYKEKFKTLSNFFTITHMNNVHVDLFTFSSSYYKLLYLCGHIHTHTHG